MESLAHIAFGLYTALIVGGACIAVLARSLVRSLVGLVATLFGVAGLYLLMAAPFIAFMQILIYVGGVSVLIFFAIMLTHAAPTGDESKSRPVRKRLNAIFAMTVPAVVLAIQIIVHGPKGFEMPSEVSLPELGAGLLGPYLLAFELISVVLFVAMAGAIMLAWRQWGKR
ncbi:MAG: NADH-quinone oxidoreductase subunit J [Desulfobacterales bacterium]